MKEKILELAKSKLGIDITNDNWLEDAVSCSFAVTTLLHECDSDIPIIYGTATLLSFLQESTLFERVDGTDYTPQGADIIISATGTNTRPEIIPHGHVGIFLNETNIASNDSATGKWAQNYTRTTWRARYVAKGGYPTYAFRAVV